MGTKATGIYFRGTTPLGGLARPGGRSYKSTRFIFFLIEWLQDEIQLLLPKPRFQPMTQSLYLGGLNSLHKSLRSRLIC